MKKFAIQIIFLLILAFGGLYLSINQNLFGDLFPSSQQPTQQQIKIGRSIVKVEVADNPGERSKGLGGRDSLASDSGMLFVFSEAGTHRFWMKGMKIPLDFIFIKNGKVVDVLKSIPNPEPNQKDADLPIYQPADPIDMMLEVNSGFIDSHGIKAGDQVYQIK